MYISDLAIDEDLFKDSGVMFHLLLLVVSMFRATTQIRVFGYFWGVPTACNHGNINSSGIQEISRLINHHVLLSFFQIKLFKRNNYCTSDNRCDFY